jgi:hypothetical protein
MEWRLPEVRCRVLDARRHGLEELTPDQAVAFEIAQLFGQESGGRIGGER